MALQGSHDTDKDTVSYTRIHVELHQKAARSPAIIRPVRITTEPAHQPNPRSDWNDHLSLANTVTVRTIHLTLLSNFDNSVIVLHVRPPEPGQYCKSFQSAPNSLITEGVNLIEMGNGGMKRGKGPS